MKICLTVFIFLCSFNAIAQSVAINNDGSGATDPKAMLEIKKAKYSKLKIRSTNLAGDTAVLELSNRNGVGDGTDFLFSQYGESGLTLSSRSDLASNTKDSIITATPNGTVGFRSLRGSGTRQVVANNLGEISTLPPKTYKMSIGADAFKPESPDGYADFTSSDPNGMAYFTAGKFFYATAPLVLPDGATITAMRAYYVDNSVSNLSFRVAVHEFALTSISYMSTINSTGVSGSFFTISTQEVPVVGSSAKINNAVSSYSLRAYPTGGNWDGINLRIKAIILSYVLE